MPATLKRLKLKKKNVFFSNISVKTFKMCKNNIAGKLKHSKNYIFLKKKYFLRIVTFSQDFITFYMRANFLLLVCE